jgi:hypothetical protein
MPVGTSIYRFAKRYVDNLVITLVSGVISVIGFFIPSLVLISIVSGAISIVTLIIAAFAYAKRKLHQWYPKKKHPGGRLDPLRFYLHRTSLREQDVFQARFVESPDDL